MAERCRTGWRSCYLVYPLVGALRSQTDGEQQLVVLSILQGTDAVRVEYLQFLHNGADILGIRITGLLGLTDGTKDPAKVEQQLRKVLPPEESNDFCHRMVLHGRAVCIARRPQCGECTLRPWCDHFAKNGG